MISSREETMFLLNRWKSESRLIQLVFNAASGIGTATMSVFGFIVDVSSNSMTVSVGNEKDVKLSIGLQDAILNIGSYEIAPEEIKKKIAEKYESYLAIRLPSNAVFFLADIREWGGGTPS